MNKLLTVSVAAYNMEKYIGECLDSLAVPEVADELEVLVVDDGGTDGTLNIAKQYAARWPNTFIPVHKENGGWGSVMNYSIAHATGKYFKFLDADDWFDRDGLLRLMSALRSTDADVVITTKICKGPDSQSMKMAPHYDIMDGTRLKVRDMPENQIFGGWYLTYKTDVVRRTGVFFPPRCLYTDQYYFTIPIAEAKDVLYLDCLLYCYRIGRDGQSVSREQRIKHLQDALNNATDLCEFCEQKRLEGNENFNYILHRVARIYANAVRTILLQPVCKSAQKQLVQFDSQIKNVSPCVYDKAIHFRGKMGFFLNLLKRTNYNAYWLLKLIPGGMPNFD